MTRAAKDCWRAASHSGNWVYSHSFSVGVLACFVRRANTPSGAHVLVSLVEVSSTTCLSDKLVVAVDLRACVAVYLPLSRLYLRFRAFLFCGREYFTVPMQETCTNICIRGDYRATLSKEKKVYPPHSSSQSWSINIKKGSKLNCDCHPHPRSLQQLCIQCTCRLCPCLCQFTNIDNSSKTPVSQTSSKRCCVTTSLRSVQAFSLKFIWAEWLMQEEMEQRPLFVYSPHTEFNLFVNKNHGSAGRGA